MFFAAAARARCTASPGWRRIEIVRSGDDHLARQIARTSIIANGGLVRPGVFSRDLHWHSAPGISRSRTIWFGPHVLTAWADRTSPEAAQLRALGWQWSARIHVIAGDLDKARAAVQALQPVGDREVDHAIAWTRDLVELRGSDLTYRAGDDTVVRGLAWRQPRRATARQPEPYERELLPALEQAAHGDGRALARALRSTRHLWLDVGALLGVLPHVTIGRDDLARTLIRRPNALVNYRDLFEWAEYAGVRRDLARLLGDTVEQTRWQQIVDRHVAVFSDRRRLMALLLWTVDV